MLRKEIDSHRPTGTGSTRPSGGESELERVGVGDVEVAVVIRPNLASLRLPVRLPPPAAALFIAAAAGEAHG